LGLTSMSNLLLTYRSLKNKTNKMQKEWWFS